jgi:hypothetical protein
MGLRPNQAYEDGAGESPAPPPAPRCRGISGLHGVFRGVPYGPRRATEGNEDAADWHFRINNLDRVFR